MEQATKPQNKKNTIIGVIVGVCMFFVSAYAVQYFFFPKPTFDETMMQVASELNKTCPIMVDNETRLDNAIALPGNIFQYNYTLINMDKERIFIDEIKKYLEPQLVRNISTNPDFKSFRENKVTMSFNYVDKNGAFVIKINVTPDKYQ